MKRKAHPAFGARRSKSSRRPARRSRRKFYRSSLRKAVRQAVLANTETKYKVQSSEQNQLWHNGSDGTLAGKATLRQWNLLGTSQGSTDTTRIGDEVFGRYLKIKVWLSNKLDRPNVMYRMFVVAVRPEWYNQAQPAGLWLGENPNIILDNFNTANVKVIYNRVIQPFGGDYSLESGAANKEHSRLITLRFPLRNRRIKYASVPGADTVPMWQTNVWMFGIVAYDAYGSIGTDNIASYAFHSKFYFKDP